MNPNYTQITAAAVEGGKKLKALVAKAQSKNGVMPISPLGAKLILESLNFPRQRSVSESQVYGHLNAIVSGDWMEGHAITFIELPDGRVWLVDGQHRLTAIARYTAPVDATIRIVPVENEREAGEFYAGFDQKSSVRTTRQIIDSFNASDAFGLTGPMASAVFEASALLNNGLEPLTGPQSTKKNPALFLQANRLKAIEEWASEARQYEALIKPAKRALKTKLLQSGPVAVALYTLRNQPARASEFWGGLAKNDGLRSNDPRSTLYADLMARNLGAGSIRQKVQQSAAAWNAFFRGRTLQQIRCVADAPIVVLGTHLEA